MGSSREAIPPGTLEMLVLQILRDSRPLHGFEIAELIAERSGAVFEVEEGSLYPALQRLLAQGLVRAEWGRTEENRRARYYRPTEAGTARLHADIERYHRISTAINLILQGEILEAQRAQTCATGQERNSQTVRVVRSILGPFCASSSKGSEA
jgi:PadR family transcriptional regulator, regulatory protein PadR